MTRKNSMPKPNIAPIALEIMKQTEPSKKRTTEMIASMLARFQIDKMQSEQRLLGERRLASQGYKAYSEGDQDGIIQEIFRRIGVTNKFFVEFGCGDGLQNNTLYLLLGGWKGVWMDGNPRNIEAVCQIHAPSITQKLLTVEHKMLDVENINNVISKLCSQKEVDLLSIDIDGNDYWVWQALDAISPRVVVIEYNATFRPPAKLVQKYVPNAQWNRTNFFGASLKALECLGNKKGYELVGCSLANGDAFFVRRDCINENFDGPFTAENFFTPPNHDLFAPLREDALPGVGQYIVLDDLS